MSVGGQSEIMMLRAFDSQDSSMLDAMQDMSSENGEVVSFDYLQQCVSNLESKDSGMHLSSVSADNSTIDLQLHNASENSKNTDLNNVDLTFTKIDNILMGSAIKCENKMKNEDTRTYELKCNIPSSEESNLFGNVNTIFTDVPKSTTHVNYNQSQSNVMHNKNDSLMEFNDSTFDLYLQMNKSSANISQSLRIDVDRQITEKKNILYSNSKVQCDNNNVNDYIMKTLTTTMKSSVGNESMEETDKAIKRCEQCSMTFRYKRHLDRHLEGHQKNNCPHCNAKFARRKHLVVHLFRSHGERSTKHIHSCDICSRCFPKKILLDRHRIKHNLKTAIDIKERTGYYKCSKCDMTFASKKKASEHFNMSHLIISEDIKNVNNDTYFCGDCRHTFFKKDDYYRHLESKVHLGKVIKDVPDRTIFPCSICSKKLMSQRALHQHVRRTHKVEKQFSCNIYCCTFQCARRTDLVRHRHLHVEERNVICEHCGKTFTSVSILNDHVLYIHNRERQFVCEECGKAFKRNSLLKRHKLSHQQIRPFACMQCSTAFKRSYHLTRHLESCHRITLEKKKKVVKLMKTEGGHLVPVPEKPKKIRHKKSNVKTLSVPDLNKKLVPGMTVQEPVLHASASDGLHHTKLNNLHNASENPADPVEIPTVLPDIGMQIVSLVDVNSGQVITVQISTPESLPMNDLAGELETNCGEMFGLSSYQDFEFLNGVLSIDQNCYDHISYSEVPMTNGEASLHLNSNNSKMDMLPTIESYITQPFP